jgi:type III restriction enzyme
MTETTQTSLIQKTPGICGGNARIRQTRIPVWTLVSFRLQGASDEELLRNYPGLNRQDLEAAWAFYASNKVEIDQIITEEND